jgi:hypothetical protein
MTPLLCVLVSMPARRCCSTMQSDRPRWAMCMALARPLTPAPITSTSTAESDITELLSV